MNCHDAHARRYRYLDGEMRSLRRVQVSLHLRRCTSCAHGFAFEKQLKIRIAGVCSDPFPPELRERIVVLISTTHETDGPGTGGIAAAPGSGG